MFIFNTAIPVKIKRGLRKMENQNIENLYVALEDAIQWSGLKASKNQKQLESLANLLESYAKRYKKIADGLKP